MIREEPEIDLRPRDMPKRIVIPRKHRTMVKPWLTNLERVKEDARKAKGFPFLVWDGEGCNATDGTMSYVLLGYNGGPDDKGRFITGGRLSTLDCLEFIWQEWQNTKNYIHMSFGFGFDVDQILRDVPQEELIELKDTNELKWKGWAITYIPRKFFSICKGAARGRKQRITIYDSISFFHNNLISVAKLYVPEDRRIPAVERGKAGRDNFDYTELHSRIIPYWRLEGQLMVNVMNALRKSLTGAGIVLKSWHGPGAIAESLIVRERVSAHIIESRIESPEQVIDATSYGYFGGRFECNAIGYIPGPVYSYDIRSAYPAALSKCPGLAGGQWRHSGSCIPDQWGLYRYTNHGKNSVTDTGMGPLPIRTHDGRVSFGLTGSGWSYGHELIAAQRTGWDIEIHEGWTYEHADYPPFDFLRDMYLQRADYKRAGNPAELACKLGLNSIYGKLAQLAGWDEISNEPPKYHNQWYAGQTTSWCRSRIWLAMSQQPENIIACETDGIYSTAPLDLRIGYQLGEWEVTEYDAMLYVQSGVYFGKVGDTWQKARTRGLSSGHVTVQDALNCLPTLTPIEGKSRRYGSMGGYVGRARHYTWFDDERSYIWGGDGKRWHDPKRCPRCRSGDLWPFDHETHRTTMTRPVGEFSEPRQIPWVSGELSGYALEEEMTEERYQNVT